MNQCITGSRSLQQRLQSPSETAEPSGRPAPLVTSRNNSTQTPFRWPRAYVQMCGKGTLALYQKNGTVRFSALACGSWSCPTCRRRLAARLLDRTRRGMESRANMNRWLVTLTCDPVERGAQVLGFRTTDDGRRIRIVSEPSPEQFTEAVIEFQRNWERITNRWRQFCKRKGIERPGYLRVVELHRNGWPHWHIVVEHPELTTAEITGFFDSWQLGRVDVRETELDGAVGEIVPYLVAAERKSNGDKAYQFAALALPKNFRLWSSSQGFLADPETEELPDIEHGVAIRGSVSSWYEALDKVAEQRVWLMPPPVAPDEEYDAPDTFVATGGNVVAFYAELVRAAGLRVPMSVSGFLNAYGVHRRSEGKGVTYGESATL